MAILSVILLTAFLTESLTEYLFGTLFEHLPAIRAWRWCLMYLAAGVGLLGAFFYRFDLISLLGQSLNLEGFDAPTWLGMAVTGLAIGRGSNYLHDLLSRHFAEQPAGREA